MDKKQRVSNQIYLLMCLCKREMSVFCFMRVIIIRNTVPPEMNGTAEVEIFKDALSSTEKKNWLKAIEDELRSYEEVGTWSVVDRTENMSVNSLWVFRKKNNNNKYKARLVAKGELKSHEKAETLLVVHRTEREAYSILLWRTDNS